MSGPTSIEYPGIRAARKPSDDGTGDHVTASVPGANGALNLTLHQAHDLIDALATVLHRPDLITAHRHQPAKRTQPGTPPAPATPRPQPPKEEHRNYDHHS